MDGIERDRSHHAQTQFHEKARHRSGRWPDAKWKSKWHRFAEGGMKNNRGLFGRFRVVLLGIAAIAVIYMSYRWVVDPKINEHPVQKISIHGDFPFDKGLNLYFTVDYRSFNPTCKQTARVFLIIPAADVNRKTTFPVPIRRIGETRYEAEIYLDYISPGFCEWGYAGMGYDILKKDELPRGGQGLGGIPRSIKKSTYRCWESRVPKTDRFIFLCRRQTDPGVKDDFLSPAELNFVLTEKPR
jgi:hypothetical protein